MIQANIKSKNPYYVDKLGQVFNRHRKLVKGSSRKEGEVKLLSYLHEDGSQKKIPFTKIIYSSYYPTISLKGYTIIRIIKDKKNCYSLYNLERIKNEELVKEFRFGNIPVVKRDQSFYKSFTSKQIKLLKTDLADKSKEKKEIAKKYNVSSTSINRAIKRFNLKI